MHPDQPEPQPSANSSPAVSMRPPAGLSLCVFCGSRLGHDPAWSAMATELGIGLAEAGHRLVFGAGRWGLMGTVAQAALEAGGEVVGIIPRYLIDLEPVLPGLTRVEVVDSMIERKLRMMDAADGFVVLPGGLGTLEELFEVWTAQQTGVHRKPIWLVSPDGFFDHLLKHVALCGERGFLVPHHLDAVEVLPSVGDLLARLHRVEPGR